MNIERLILEKLLQVHPRMLSETVLWSACRIEDPDISLTIMRSTLRTLKSKDQIAIVQLEDAKRIKIKPAGIVRLEE